MRRFRLGWRVWWFLGFALLGVYLAFDVMDLDRSDFPTQFGHDTIVTASARTEADRLVRCDLCPLHLLPDLGVSNVRGPQRTFRGDAHGGRRLCNGLLLPRRQLVLKRSIASPPPADPV